MRRPNLSRVPFLDIRPVWLAGVALAAVATVLTAASVWEVAHARGNERVQTRRITELRAREVKLLGEAEREDRELAAVKWKQLQLETASLEHIVARRQFAWTTLLSNLERVVPWDARLVSIEPSLDEKGKVTVALTGIATGRDAWLRLLKRLLTDDHFSEPVPLSEQAPGAGNALGYKYAVRVRYWPEGRR